MNISPVAPPTFEMRQEFLEKAKISRAEYEAFRKTTDNPLMPNREQIVELCAAMLDLIDEIADALIYAESNTFGERWTWRASYRYRYAVRSVEDMKLISENIRKLVKVAPPIFEGIEA